MRDEEAKEVLRERVISGDIIGAIGLKKSSGHTGPCFFQRAKDLEGLVLSPKYPLATTCKRVQEAYPEGKIGVLVRGCDERALVELGKRNHVDLNRLELIGVACTLDEALGCHCDCPYPKEIMVGEKTEGIPIEEMPGVKGLLSKSVDERLAFWEAQFSKCIKCYGCRNACPVCLCDECILEEELWVGPGEIPPKFPLFHLIRAFHVADKCTGCGECERACPMGIPLSLLYVLMRKDLQLLFDYVPGMDTERQSPIITNLEMDAIRES